MSAPECAAWSDADRPSPDARRWSGLAVLCLSLFVLALDNTKLVVALPLLGKAFADEPGALRWLPEAYLFVYACLLALGGLLSERFGARRTLLTGGVLFGVASAAAALASTGLALLSARAVMGAAGALMTPATLATIRHTFDEQERPKAVALWTASFGVGSALGPVLAGALLDGFSWRSIFWINLPVALVIVSGTLLRVSPHLPRRAVPLDALGTLLALLTTGLTLFVILEGPALGARRPELWLAAGGAVAAGAAFFRWERRTPHPLFDLELFRSARFRVALGVIVLTYLAFAGVTFVMAQYLQLGRGYDPLRAGNLTVPVALAMLVGTLCAPLASARLGSRGALLYGVSLALAGFALLGVATHLEHDLVLAMAQLPLGLGSGVAFATATDMVVSSGTAERAGSAAALNETAFELGGVLGIALLSRVLAAGATGKAPAIGASTTAAVGLGALAVGLAIVLTLRLRSGRGELDSVSES